MKMFARMIEWIDNRMNPIVVKELRQAVRSRAVISILLLFLLLEVFILGAMLLFGAVRTGGELDPTAGRTIFLTLQGILLGTCLVLIPVYAGVRLGSERSDTNVDLLFTSTLKPGAILWGKFVAALVLALLIFSACAPFMTFTYLLRGLDISTIVLVLGFDLLVVLACTMAALFLASIPAGRGLKILLGLQASGWLIWAFSLAMVFSYEMVSAAGARLTSGPDFAALVGTFVACTLLLMGLFFVWAMAFLRPPSSNRALPVRLYQLFVWLGLGGLVVWLAAGYREPSGILGWEVPMFFLFGLQIWISANERDSWGPRVARTIPRRPWWRIVAFFLYSGAAGGVLFGVVMVGLTVGLGYLTYSWIEASSARYFVPAFPGAPVGPTPPTDTFMTVATNRMVLGGLYIYCYAMTAVWLRLALFKNRLRTNYTWLLCLILVAVGNFLPYAIILVYATNPSQFQTQHEWVCLTSPTLVLERVGSSGGYAHQMDWVALLFTAGWAMLMTLLCMPWFGRQMAEFRPLVRTGRPPVLAEVVKEVVPLEVDPTPVLMEGTGGSGNGQTSPHIQPAPADGPRLP